MNDTQSAVTVRAGVGFLWLFPYMATSFTLFYEDIRPKADKATP